MSFTSYPLRRIEETVRSVTESARTLPDWQLANEIAALRQSSESTIGPSAAGLMLRALEAEQERRGRAVLI